MTDLCPLGPFLLMLNLWNFWLFFCVSEKDGIFVLCPGVVRYIGPVGGKKRSYVGLHLDSPGEEQ